MNKIFEPININSQSPSYVSEMSRAFNWYNQEKDKKDARHYLKSFLGREKSRFVDRVPDNGIICTFAWMARMKVNGCTFKTSDENRFQDYISNILSYKEDTSVVEVREPQPERPSVRDYLEEKVKEYLGELEGVLDSIIYEGKEFNLYKDMQSRSLPAQYCSYVSDWVKRKAGEFIAVYETKDTEVKNAYSHIGKRGQTSLIKMFSEWLEDLARYSQYKKANRKPRVKKAKPAGAQVSKLKYKKEDTEFKLKSVSPVEIVGASQVWVFNTKYKKLAVYRSDSKDGIQVKGSSLQNYDPQQSEQRTLRKPQEMLKKVIDGGKLQLRKLLTDLTTTSVPVNGRINDECIIVRVIR